MRIRVLGIRGLPATYSGLETIMGELAPRWVDAGHEVIVYCRKAVFKERPPEWRGVKLIYLPSIEHKVFSTLSHSFLASMHASLTASDIILTWNAGNGPFGWFFRIAGKTAVINVDGMEWLRPKWKGIGAVYFKWAAKMATSAFPIVITDAAEMKRLYLEELGAETTYIAYGANIEPSEHPEVLEEYGLKSRDYYLIASRLVPDNNADLIMEAFVTSKSEKKLAIAGGADYKGNKLENEFLDKLKSIANDNVMFLGHIDNSDHIKELHHHCFGYIHGHQFGGINPSILKALGFSNCILALNTPFNNEVLENGKYGVLFDKTSEDLKDKIETLEQNPETVEDYRSRAPEQIRKKFNWDHIAEQYIEVFDELQKKK
ncbi:MAG: glycosyltransferase [Candidatus Poribacteria bacterium]|nr:glycosyltransferase [Candidatus Poribacteria bacterium]